MKLNQNLIKRLAAGEIQLQHTGTIEALNEILQAAFPEDSSKTNGVCVFYRRAELDSNLWHEFYYNNSELPIYTTETFYEPLPDTKQTMDKETRELAKQLFVHAGAGSELCIKFAKEFIKLLNESE